MWVPSACREVEGNNYSTGSGVRLPAMDGGECVVIEREGNRDMFRCGAVVRHLEIERQSGNLFDPGLGPRRRRGLLIKI